MANPALTHIRETILHIEDAVRGTIIGQDHLIRRIIIALFAGGHVLIEGVPGLGKTLTIKTLAGVLGYGFKRISFTPDLLPSDLTGTEIYRADTGKFELRKGPIFTEILLADEINRTPPKVQSALLEAMEEKHVTIGDATLELPKTFFVLATENPIEHEGTYPLPEAELDRFLMKILIDYPAPVDEKLIWKAESNTPHTKKSKEIPSTIDLIEMRDYIAKHIRVDDAIYDYISRILEATRSRGMHTSSEKSHLLARFQKEEMNTPPLLSYGASTRAGLALIRTARVLALIEGRDYVLPEDIKALTPEVLRHRLLLSYSALSTGQSVDDVIDTILESVEVV